MNVINFLFTLFKTDVIFFIYLYQKWIYPIDLKRVNEFGISGEDLQKVDNNGVLKTGEAQQNQAKENGDVHEKNE